MSKKADLLSFFSLKPKSASKSIVALAVAPAAVKPVLKAIEKGAPAKRTPYGKHTPAEVLDKLALSYITQVTKSMKEMAEEAGFKESTLKSRVKKLKDNGVVNQETLTAWRGKARTPGQPSLLVSAQCRKDFERLLLLHRAQGAPLTLKQAAGCADAMVRIYHPLHLKRNGGNVSFTSAWAAQWYHRHNWVSRAITTGKRHPPKDLALKRRGLLSAYQQRRKKHKIPLRLVWNLDETAVHVLPVKGRTMDKKGVKKVAVTGADDKRQITATIAVSATGEILDPHLVFTGKTPRCLPKKAPKGWYLTYSPTHWSNGELFLAYVKKTLIQWWRRSKRRRAFHLSSERCWFLISGKAIERFKKNSRPLL